MGNQLSYLDEKSIVDLFSSVCVTRQFLGVCNAQLWIQQAPSRLRCETQVFAMLQITSQRMRKLAAVIFENCQYIWIISPKQTSWIFAHRNMFPNVKTVFGSYRGLELPYTVSVEPFVFPRMDTLLLETSHKSLETFPQSALKKITTLMVRSGWEIGDAHVKNIKALCPSLKTLYISAPYFTASYIATLTDLESVIAWAPSHELPVSSNTRGTIAFVDILTSRRLTLHQSWEKFTFALYECARVDAYEEEIRVHDKDQEMASDFLKWNFIDGKVCKDVFQYFLEQYDAVGVDGLSDKNYEQAFKLLKGLFPQFHRALCAVGRAFNPVQTPKTKPYMWCNFLPHLELPQWSTSEQALEEFQYELNMPGEIWHSYKDGFIALIKCRGADRTLAFWKPVLQLLIQKHGLLPSNNEHKAVDGLLAILQSAETCFDEYVRFVDWFCARMCNQDLFRHLMLCLLQFNHREVEVANLAMTSECILLSSDAMFEYAVFRRQTSLTAVEIMKRWDEIKSQCLIPIREFLFAEMKDWVRDELIFSTPGPNKYDGQPNPPRKISNSVRLDSTMSDLAIAQALQEQEYFEAMEFGN